MLKISARYSNFTRSVNEKFLMMLVCTTMFPSVYCAFRREVLGPKGTYVPTVPLGSVEMKWTALAVVQAAVSGLNKPEAQVAMGTLLALVLRGALKLPISGRAPAVSPDNKRSIPFTTV